MVVRVPDTRNEVDISAVVIARNEEKNIRDVVSLLLGALARAKNLGLCSRYEVCLVDSASQDRTVELASSFPIRIVRLRRGWPLSAAAGRATGARLAKGRLLLFVDGDYLLSEEWLPQALGILRDSRVAGVTGWDLEEVSGTTVLAKRLGALPPANMPTTSDIDSLASGLVRRQAYEAVGGIHPFLRGAEDRDFGLRLVSAGWRIVKTRTPMGTHRWTEPGTPMTYVDYFRSVAVWSLGDGQACRLRWGTRSLRRAFLSRYATLRYLIQHAQFAGACALGLANLAAIVLPGWPTISVAAIDGVLLAAFHALRRAHGWTWAESVYELQGAVYGPYRTLLFGLGLLTHSRPPHRYPTDVEIVRDVPPADSRGVIVCPR